MHQGLRSRGMWALLGGLLITISANADWLVTRNGQRIETSGPWQVKGKQVLFTAANGTLSSIRLSEVDLELSEQASRPPAVVADSEAQVAEPQPKKKPVLVLTDKDVARARVAEPATATPAAEARKAATATSPTAPRTEPVVLVSWQQMEKDPSLGVEIMGTVRNTSAEIVTGVAVQVKLLDGDGELIAEKQASLSPSALAAGVAANFRVLFGDVISFATPKFDIRSTAGARVVGAASAPKPAEN